MSIEMNYLPGDENIGGKENTGNQQENEISLPKNDRPEGPFPHSGETAGWTEAEETEIKEGQQQQEDNPQEGNS